MVTFRFDHFTPVSRALDLAGLALAMTLVLVGLIIAIGAMRQRTSGNKRSAAALRPALALLAGGLLFLGITQVEGARAVTVRADSVTVEYRFRPDVEIARDSITSVDFRIERENRGRKGIRSYAKLVINHGGKETTVVPLSPSSASLEEMRRARDVLQSIRVVRDAGEENAVSRGEGALPRP